MNRKELVDAIAGKTGLTKKDAESFLNGFIETVSKELKKGGSVFQGRVSMLLGWFVRSGMCMKSSR